jgi:hypothetical protein
MTAEGRWLEQGPHYEDGELVLVNRADLKLICDLYDKGDTTAYDESDDALERLYRALESVAADEATHPTGSDDFPAADDDVERGRNGAHDG